jgi:Protein of unknown function (DUF4054)
MASAADVADFKAKLPEMAATGDPVISAALDEADMWLEAGLWHAPDFPWARVFLAAHHILMAQIYGGGGAAEGGGGSAIATDLFVRMVAFGERRVMFGERKTVAGAGEGKMFGAGEAALEDTIYGQRFLRLRSRNIIGILTV